MAKRISIIIPTLNEASHLSRALDSTLEATNVERLVVDGGSDDGTLELAREWGARVLLPEAGRARQMNAGARIAGGQILLFLHADTRLPERFDDHVREVMAQPGVAAGAFQLRIDGAGRGFRIIEKATNWRSRQLQMPYGDQGIFVENSLFFKMGEFPDIPIMEDFEFISRLRKRGRIVIAAEPVTTSARRWNQLGPWRTTLLNQTIILAYCLGVAPSRIARWYYCDRPNLHFSSPLVTKRRKGRPDKARDRGPRRRTRAVRRGG